MTRARLCELLLSIEVGGDHIYRVSWTLRSQHEYPPRPGRPQHWNVLAEHTSEFQIPEPARRSVIVMRARQLFADLALTPGATQLVDRLREQRAQDSWVRVVVELLDPHDLDRWWDPIQLPWDE